MAQSEQYSHAETRPRSAQLGLKVLLLMAPIAAAAAIVALKPAPERVAIDGLVAMHCTGETGVQIDDQIALSRAYFDTAWLPEFSDFTTVASDAPGGRLWNPLGNSWLTGEQLDLLSLAYKVGYQDGGEAQAKLLQAVLMQESIAGQLGRLGHLSAPLGKRSYGVMQVKLAAARDVLAWKPKYGEFSSDDELIARLIADDEFNLRIASTYLKYLRRITDNDHEALVAYNLGPNAAKRVPDPAQYRYVLSIENYLTNVVAPFNGKFASEATRTASM